MISSLLLLPETDLAPLIAALRSGRLSPPFTPGAVGQFVGHSLSAATAEAMEQLHQVGLSEAQLAAALELVLQDRRRRPRLEDAIDLVTSGPDAPGLANRDTAVVVRELFANAVQSVLVAGYVVFQGHRVFQALADRMQEYPDLAVRMFLDVQRNPGDTSADSELVRRFALRFRNHDWPKDRPLPRVFYDPRSLELSPHKRSCLHAKCVAVDKKTLFVSSANFTEAAQERNLEVGVLIHSRSIAEQLVTHFDTLLSAGLMNEVSLQ
jgi:phosphatidylserine/phosphatidylglycerophosphate/cardiolipin synthase-like enzyme